MTEKDVKERVHCRLIGHYWKNTTSNYRYCPRCGLRQNKVYEKKDNVIRDEDFLSQWSWKDA